MENTLDFWFWKDWNRKLLITAIVGVAGILIPPPIGSIMYFSSLVSIVLLVLQGLQRHIRQTDTSKNFKIFLSTISVILVIFFYFVMVAFYFAFISLF